MLNKMKAKIQNSLSKYSMNHCIHMTHCLSHKSSESNSADCQRSFNGYTNSLCCFIWEHGLYCIPIYSHQGSWCYFKTILKLRAITTWHYKPQMTWNVHGIFPVPTLKLKPLWVEQAQERHIDKNDNIHKNLKWITSHLPQNVEITLEFCHLFAADGMEFIKPAHNHHQQLLQSVHTWNWKKYHE